MDFVFELLVEIILEGCIGVAKEKKVPLILRILCVILLVVFYGGFIGILLYIAVSEQSVAMIFITGIVALIILFGFIYKFREIKKNKEK